MPAKGCTCDGFCGMTVADGRHGTTRGYRVGCRCEPCRSANTEAAAKRRAAKRAESQPETRPDLTVVDITDRLPATPDEGADEPEPFTVSITLRKVLETVPDSTPLVAYRKAHALTLAAVLDDPRETGRYGGISKALHDVMSRLLPDEAGVDENAAILAAIRGAGRS